MALSKLEICNRALARIGEGTRLTDFAAQLAAGEKPAVQCDIVFTSVLKEAGRGGDWNCLRARATVLSAYAIAYAAWLVLHPGDTDGAETAGDTAQDLVTGGFGWARSYALPSTCERVIQFNGMDIYNDGIEGFYEIEGRVLFSDDET